MVGKKRLDHATDGDDPSPPPPTPLVPSPPSSLLPRSSPLQLIVQWSMPWPAHSSLASHPTSKALSSQFAGPAAGSGPPNAESAAVASSRRRALLHHSRVGRQVSCASTGLSGRRRGRVGHWSGRVDVGPLDCLDALVHQI
jgi:hypothetical protein